MVRPKDESLTGASGYMGPTGYFGGGDGKQQN